MNIAMAFLMNNEKSKAFEHFEKGYMLMKGTRIEYFPLREWYAYGLSSFAFLLEENNKKERAGEVRKCANMFAKVGFY